MLETFTHTCSSSWYYGIVEFREFEDPYTDANTYLYVYTEEF